MLSDTACKNAHRGDKAKTGKASSLLMAKAYFSLLSHNPRDGANTGVSNIALTVKKNCWPLAHTPKSALTKPDKNARKQENKLRQILTQAKTKKQSKQPRQKAQPIALK